MTAVAATGLAAARTRIAAVLAGIDGLDAHERQPDVIAAGTAWPRWQQSIPLTGCGDEHTFMVLVALAAGPSGTPESHADELLPRVREALIDAFVLDRAAPDAMTTESGTGLIPLLRFDIRLTD